MLRQVTKKSALTRIRQTQKRSTGNTIPPLQTDPKGPSGDAFKYLLGATGVGAAAYFGYIYTHPKADQQLDKKPGNAKEAFDTLMNKTQGVTPPAPSANDPPAKAPAERQGKPL